MIKVQGTSGVEAKAQWNRKAETADRSAPPLVSIAVCTYNGERFLSRQLETLLWQTISDLEIVVVDDVSTDGTWTMLEAWSQRDPRVRIFRNETNLGYRKNFERAVCLCRGEFVALSDQDDIWHPDKLAVLLASIGTHSAAYCDSELVDAQERSLGVKVSMQRNMYAGSDPAAFAFSNSVSGHALLFRRALLSAAIPFPSEGFHDWWLAFVAASDSGIVYVDRPLVLYRQHAITETDLAGLRGRRKDEDRVAKFEEKARWLHALASLNSRHQAFFRELCQAWCALPQQWFSFRLFSLIFSRRRAMHFIDKNAMRHPVRRALHDAVGLRTRRLYHRSRYSRQPALPHAGAP